MTKFFFWGAVLFSVIPFSFSNDSPVESPRIRFVSSNEGVSSFLQSTESLKQTRQAPTIPVHLKTGRDVLGPKKAFDTVMEDLKSNYDLLNHQVQMSRERELNPVSLPFLAYFESLLTPEITESIPASLIMSVGFSLRDSDYQTALKLERLGLKIKDLSIAELSPQTFEKKNQLMGRCFILSAAKIHSILRQCRIYEGYTSEEIEFLRDLIKSGQVLNYWAAFHVPQSSLGIIHGLSLSFNDYLSQLEEFV